jgi:chromosome segregation ATPase
MMSEQEETYDEYMARKEQHEYDLLERDYKLLEQKLASVTKELGLRDQWVKHHQKSVELSMEREHKITKERDELKLENERFREALEFYQQGYAHSIDDSHNAYFENGHIRLASGKRARQALSASAEEER